MSNNAQKVAAVVAGIGILNGVLESPTVQQAIPTNEPSSSQVQTTETKCDPLADKSKEPSDEEKYGIPSEEIQQLGDSQDKSDDDKKDQIDKDIAAENQPTISGPPNADNFQETDISPDRQIIPRPDSQLSTEVASLPNNADLANQLRGETSSPSSQNEPQEVNGDSGNI